MSEHRAVVRGEGGNRLARHILLRLAQGVLVLWGAFTLSFLILYLLPGDPVSILIAGDMGGGDIGAVSQEQIDALRAEYHLDQPLFLQYLLALGSAVTWDFGTSIRTGNAVSEMLLGALPETLQLASAALLLSLVVGVAIALLVTLSSSERLAGLLRTMPAAGVAVPTFWIGLLLLQFLSFQNPVFPAMGNDGFAALVLPAIALSVPHGALVAQVLIRSLADAWEQPYIQVVKTKGLSRIRRLLAHALRNAIIPALSMAGVIAGNLLAGSVVVETVFTRNGIGRLTQTAVQSQDTPVVQAVVVFAAFVFVLVNLIVDLLYPLIDPRLIEYRVRRVSRKAHTA